MFITVLVCAAVCAIAAFLILRAKERREDRLLDLEFRRIKAEARSMLSSASLAELNRQLGEILGIGQTAYAQGATAREANRMAKAAAIQSIAASIEIERMLSGPMTFPDTSEPYPFITPSPDNPWLNGVVNRSADLDLDKAVDGFQWVAVYRLRGENDLARLAAQATNFGLKLKARGASEHEINSAKWGGMIAASAEDHLLKEGREALKRILVSKPGLTPA